MAKAFVVLTPDFAALDDDNEIIRMLKNHVRKEIGPVASIRSTEFTTDLPRQADGSIDRQALYAQENKITT